MNRLMSFQTPVAVVLFLFLGIAPAHGQDNVRTVILSGQEAAVGVNETVVEFAREVSINNQGETAFFAFVTDSENNPSSSDNLREALYSEGGGNGLQLVAAEGEASPITGTIFTQPFRQFPFLEQLDFNDLGEVVFSSFVANSPTDSSSGIGLFKWSSSQGVTAIASSGQPVPSLSSTLSSFGFRNALSETGTVAFTGVVEDRFAFQSAAFYSNGNGFSTSYIQGDVVTSPSGQTLTLRGVRFPVGTNDSGQFVFDGEVAGVGVDISNDGALLLGAADGSSGLQIVNREGNAVPGAGNILFFEFLPAFNNSGQVAYVARTDDLNNRGEVLLVTQGQTTTPIAIAGRDTFEELGNDDWTLAVIGVPQLNDAGKIAFDGIVDDFRSGIEIIATKNPNGNLELVAATGIAAPEINGTFDFTFTQGRNAYALNNHGQIAFSATIIPSESGAANRFGIFAQDREGKLRLIARSGGLLNVSTSGDTPDYRVIQTVIFREAGGFNDLGQLAFLAFFTDGSSGFFVSDLATTADPLPTSIALSLPGGMELSEGAIELFNTETNSDFDVPTSFSLLEAEALTNTSEVTASFTALSEVPAEQIAAQGYDRLISDVLELSGFDENQHVVQLTYDSANEENAELLWFNESGQWVNAILGNSNAGELLNSTRFDGSYSEYLATRDGQGAELGAFGAEGDSVWAVIDHNSSFAVGTEVAVLLGDVNPDGVVNFLDIGPFISILSGGDYLSEADVNEDGEVNFLDISPFISILSSQ